MAYEYGVNLKLDSEKALKDIDVLLGKLQQMEKAAGQVKLKISATNDVEKQQREFMKQLQQMQAAEQKLATQRQLNEEKVQQAQDKTNAQQLLHEERVAQAQNKTATQRATNEEKIRQEQQKTATEAEKQAMDVLKANEKVRQEKEKSRQEEQKTAQSREQTARAEQKTNQEAIRTEAQKVEFVNKLYTLYQRVSREREHEEDRLRRIANAEKRATEQAEKRAAAVAKAVAARQKEELISQATSGFFTASRRYATVGKIGQISGSVLNNVSQSLGLIQQAASQLTSNLWGYAQRIGSQIISQVEKIAETALEQYKTLETAEIGFGNFFNGSPAAFTQQVRQRAEEMPGVGAQDLVRGIQYIAPLAGGNSQLALNAAEGVMKSILYSGNDVSAYGTNALQNLQQLASGNFTYADIRQMLRAMPTLPSLLASSDSGKELLDNGAITTEKLKAYIKKNGQDALLELFADISKNSAASDIYDKYRKTLSGAIEETGEHIKNAWNDAMENAGVYRTVTQFLNKIVDNKVLDETFRKLGDVVAKVINWLKNEKNADEIKAYFNTLQTVLKSFRTVLGQVAKDLGRSLGFLNANGTLNTTGLRQLTRQLTEFVKGLVKGFGGGLKTIIDLAKRFADSMGADGWRKLGEIIGTLASPLGKLITLLTKFGAALSSVIGSFGSGLSGIFKWLGNNSSATLEKMLGTAAMTNAGFDSTAASGSSMAGLLVAGNGSKGIMSSATASKFAGFAKWGSGVLRAGAFAGIIQAVGGVTQSLIELSGVFGDASKGIQHGVKGVTDGLSAAVLAFSLTGGGLLGGVVGAVAGLVVGIESYTNAIVNEARKMQTENDQKFLQEVEEKSDGFVSQYADYIFEQYKNASGKEIDKNSEEGRAAYDNLRNYIASQIVEYDDNGNLKKVDPQKLKDKFQEVFGYFIDDYKQQLRNSGLVDYTATEGFYGIAQSGNKIDLDQSPELRDKAADLIRRGLLNGTDAAEGGVYDYTQSNEKIVRDYLETIGMDDFTTGALQALLEQEALINEHIKPDTDDIKKRVAELDEEDPEFMKNATAAEVRVANATEGANDILNRIEADVAIIARKEDANALEGLGLSTEKVQQWDSGHFTDILFAPKEKDAIAKALGDSGDIMSDISKNLNKTYADAASMSVYAVTDEEKEEARNALKITKQMATELGKINPNDWKALLEFLQKHKDHLHYLGIDGAEKLEEAIKSAGIRWSALTTFAHGGSVKPVYRAMGGRGVDSVPAYLQPGEYVVRQRSASLAGMGVLDAINRGDLGAAARTLGAKVSGHWNNSRSYSNTVNNNQKTVTNNMFFGRRTRAGRLNQYYSLANGMASGY